MARKRIAVDVSVEALFTEKALAMSREMRQTAKDAPDGEYYIRRNCSRFAGGRS